MAMLCMLMHMMGHQDHSTHKSQPVDAHGTQHESLLDILKRRYALSEITKEQFEAMKRDLGL
jgi:uncharacterized membrane protein